MNIIKKYKVDNFSCGAYKHVPMIEKNVIEGFNNNVIGTLSCIEASINTSISNFVLISTDKAVRPTNVMGQQKGVRNACSSLC